MIGRVLSRMVRPVPRVVAQGTRGIFVRAMVRKRISLVAPRMAPHMTLERLRRDNTLFNTLYRLYERAHKSKKLIKDISKRIQKMYPFQGQFLINDDEGRKVKDFTFGKVLGKGCNGVAFSAKLKRTQTDPDFNTSDSFTKEADLVVKQMFNYNSYETNSIFSDFKEEQIFNKDVYSKRKLLHPFIMPIERKFIGEFAHHPQRNKYRAACPDKSGMDRTLYLVSKKMDTDLNQLFKGLEKKKTTVTLNNRLLMSYQLYEAVAHLEKIGFAHRDIKPDNIFIKRDPNGGPPLVLLGDWGCATDNLKFMNEEPSGRYDLRKGNGAYCPPEIMKAVPGNELDYRRADSWSISLIVLDILKGGRGMGNPFYPIKNRQTLKNAEYTDDDLNICLNEPSDVPESIFGMIRNMLSVNPSKRPSSRLISDNIFCRVFQLPSVSSANNQMESFDKLDGWLLNLYHTVIHGNQEVADSVSQIKLCFLRNMCVSTFQQFFRFQLSSK